ncbi:MAG: hypothetical protein ACYTF6_13045, partial [Planctomycetota bacterium]
LSALRPTDPGWAAAVLRQIDLLNAYAAAVFADNVKAGRDDENAKLTEHQKRMLNLMVDLVSRHADQASTVLQKLWAHLQPWLGRGHYALAEQAYTQLTAALPAAQKRQAELALVEVWHRQVAERHNKLLAAGLKVPRKLDPVHIKALERCYSLQADLNEGDQFLNRVRVVWESILRHYSDLEYWDVAEQAIKVRPEQAVDAADAYAQLTLGNFYYNRARQQLGEFLAQYGAAEKITLPDVFKKAIA